VCFVDCDPLVICSPCLGRYCPLLSSHIGDPSFLVVEPDRRPVKHTTPN
jgi:hypothetical protein